MNAINTVDIDTLKTLIYSTKRIINDHSLAVQYEEKGTADYVTKVDTSVQEFFQKELGRLYPHIQFMGEEGQHSEIDPEKPIWILDPIDGTTNLIHDYRMSAVSLALAENGEPVLGIVYNPFTEEMFCAKKGGGAYLNDNPISVSHAGTLSDSLIAVGTSPYEKERAYKNFELFRELFIRSQDIRRTGSAALDLCYIACGRTDGYLEQNLKPWDFSAGLVILSEAGGTGSMYDGALVDIFSNSDILASNGHIHRELISVIESVLG